MLSRTGIRDIHHTSARTYTHSQQKSPTNPRHSRSPTTPAPGTTSKPHPHPQAHAAPLSTGTTTNITSLDANTSYTYKAYSDSGPAQPRSHPRQFTTLAEPTLTASNITHQPQATLTITNHTGTWYYKQTIPTPTGNMQHRYIPEPPSTSPALTQTHLTPTKPTPTLDLHHRNSIRNNSTHSTRTSLVL